MSYSIIEIGYCNSFCLPIVFGGTVIVSGPVFGFCVWNIGGHSRTVFAIGDDYYNVVSYLNAMIKVSLVSRDLRDAIDDYCIKKL